MCASRVREDEQPIPPSGKELDTGGIIEKAPAERNAWRGLCVVEGDGLHIGVTPSVSIPVVGELTGTEVIGTADGLFGNGKAVEEYRVLSVHCSNVHCGNDILFHIWRPPPSSP